MKLSRLVLVFVVGLAFTMSGCKPKDAEKKADEKKAEEKTEAKAEEKAAPAEAPAEAPAAPPPPAEEAPAAVPAGDMSAFQTAVAALDLLKAKNVAGFATFLPPKYLSDIDGLVRAFAEAMDKELWDKTIALTDRIMKIAANKKDALVQLIVGMGMAPVSPEDLGKVIDGLVTTWTLMKELGLADLETLKTFDAAKFAAESLPKLSEKMLAIIDQTPAKAEMEAELKRLETVEITLVGTEDDKETLEFGMTGEEEKEKVTFVKVEGKWLPEDMVKEWDEAIKGGMEAIAEMKEALPAAKAEILPMFAQVEEVVTKIEETGDLTAAFAALAMMGGGGMEKEEAPAEDAPAEEAPAEEAPAEEAPAEEAPAAEAPAEEVPAEEVE
jgi:hypothetical protein